MFEDIIIALIQLCIFVAIAYVILWVLGRLGIDLPPMVVNIFWLIVGLIVLLMLYKAVAPSLRGGKLFGLLEALPMLT